ncbi:fungal-specific transcription factor domain-containing protein [Xylogone sp. PMI_703]|nr:fungal-specific transcription factor domain-containing protein [Xylogone sp. PMI_703]
MCLTLSGVIILKLTLMQAVQGLPIGKHGTACRTCRRRGRRCDKTLPSCQSCKNRGSLCEGYVTRWPGVAARGRFAGKAVPVENALLNKHTRIKSPALKRSQPNLSNEDLLKFVVIGDTNEEVGKLIEYYAHELSTVFYLGATPADSPYALYIIPMAKEVLPLRYAIAASASSHLATRLGGDGLEMRSRVLRLKAIELLRSRLQCKEVSTDFGTLASMLMMAQLDLCSGDCAEFDTHIPAAKTLIDHYGADKTDKGFFEQRLAWLDIMRSTTSSRFPTFSSADIKKIVSRFSSARGREWGCDVFPCPIDLFEYIADITMLYKLHPNIVVPSEDIIKKAVLLGRRISEWKPHTTYSPLKSHVVGAWHKGILLYEMRLFRISSDKIFNAQALKNGIFEHAKSVAAASSWSFSMLWPLFQAGLFLANDDLEGREWIQQRLETMSQAAGCKQFGIALETLNLVWSSNVYYNSITAGELKGPLMLA